jgi:hypothetical protein
LENGEQPPEKTAEEIQQEAEEEIAHVACLARELDKARNIGKRHNGMQDDSGASDDDPRDGAPMRRHHTKFDSRYPANQDRLQNRSQSIQEMMGRIEYQGEQVYSTPMQNTLASRMLIDQLTPHQPKDNQEVIADIKRLQAMLDAATMVDSALNCDDEAWGHDHDHR